MQDKPTSLDEVLMKGVAPKPKGDKPAEQEESDSLTLADMNGSFSTMRPANKNLTRMHVVDKAGKVRSFQYNYLDVESIFDGGTITLVFSGTKHWQITAKGQGPDVWRAYDLITLHRLPYLREEVRQHVDDKETVFTEIKIVDVTPKEKP
jgi:hypothetical protein